MGDSTLGMELEYLQPSRPGAWREIAGQAWSVVIVVVVWGIVAAMVLSRL